MRKQPGKIKVKLAELLLKEGFMVSCWDLEGQQGVYRGPHYDLACCFGYGVRVWNGVQIKCYVYSWSTMTKCVKNGIYIVEDQGHDIEFSAKEPQ